MNPVSRPNPCLLLGILALFGCATVTTVENRTWVEASTENIRLITDADEKLAGELAEGLEWFRGILMTVASIRPEPPPIPTTAFVFKRHSTYRMFLNDYTAGFFHQTPHANYLAVDGSPGLDGMFQTACHEYIHLTLSSSREIVYPLWYHEGLATLLSGLYPRGPDLHIGRVNDWWRRVLRKTTFVPFETLLSVGVTSDVYSSKDRATNYHGTAWALIHYLLIGEQTRRQQLDRYLKLWLQAESPREAFQAAFGVDVRSLEREVKNYLRQKELPYWILPVVDYRIPTRAKVRSVPTAEALYRLGEFAAQMRKDALGETLLRASLVRDPDHAPSYAWLADILSREGRFDEAEKALLQALKLAPDDPQVRSLYGTYWIRRLLAEGSPADALERARTQYALSLDQEPFLPHTYMGVAQTYLLGDSDAYDLATGIEAARAAHDLLPGNPEIAYVLAQLYIQAEREAEAIPLLRLVVQFSEDRDVVANARGTLITIGSHSPLDDPQAAPTGPSSFSRPGRPRVRVLR